MLPYACRLPLISQGFKTKTSKPNNLHSIAENITLQSPNKYTFSFTAKGKTNA